MINGVKLPEADLRGRAFPYNNSNIHFVGPALIEGKVYRMNVWINFNLQGREYIRVTFEKTETEENVPFLEN